MLSKRKMLKAVLLVLSAILAAANTLEDSDVPQSLNDETE